jgi:sulfur-carrier protein adenylyltransferase/sulfurtransferase
VLPPDDVTSTRLPAEYERLKSIRVGIIGMGSLGSKVAVSRARSGLRRFLLIDDDVLMPGNICRHELCWAAAGVHKVEAVQEALDLIAPDMDVIVRVHRLGGQESSMVAAAALKDLGSCDLIVDATANPSVFLLAATVAGEKWHPMCWGEVFAGGSRDSPHVFAEWH